MFYHDNSLDPEVRATASDNKMHEIFFFNWQTVLEAVSRDTFISLDTFLRGSILHSL